MPGYKVRVIQDLIDISNKTGSGFFATRGRVASTGRTLVMTNEDGTRGMIVVSEKIATNAKARRYIPFRYAIHFTEGGPWVSFELLLGRGSSFNSRREATTYIRQIAVRERVQDV